MANKILEKARKNKNDEFYTYYEDIENELKHYIDYFNNKNIFCPCDDLDSNFWKYFYNNFKNFNLNSLTCTSLNGNKYIKIKNLPTITLPLKENGDIFSEEIFELMKDKLIITNPPFSSLKDFIKKLIDTNQQFILVGNENLFGNKNIFPLFKNNTIKIGYTYIKKFFTEDNSIKNFGNIVWITNLPIENIHPDLKLTKTYNPIEYPKYENYEAINVDKIENIPKDYFEPMGVPITYIKKATSQFEILGLAGGATKKNGLNYSVPYHPHPNDRGGSGIINGERKYLRVLIKRKT